MGGQPKGSGSSRAAGGAGASGRAAAVGVRCGGGSGQRDLTRGEDSSMAVREPGDGARQAGRREGGRRGGRWP